MSLITKISDLAIAIANEFKGIYTTVESFDTRVTDLEGSISGADDSQGTVIAPDTDLNTLITANGSYRGGGYDNISNLPATAQLNINNFVVDVNILNVNGGAVTEAMQTLTAVFGTYDANKLWATYRRVYSNTIGAFTPWERIAGIDPAKFYGGGGANDIEVKHELITLPITLDGFGYNADGSFKVDQTQSGFNSVYSSVTDITKILSITYRLYHEQFAGYTGVIDPNLNYSGTYQAGLIINNSAVLNIKTLEHATLDGDAGLSGQDLFDKPSYIELFVTYKAD